MFGILSEAAAAVCDGELWRAICVAVDVCASVGLAATLAFTVDDAEETTTTLGVVAEELAELF